MHVFVLIFTFLLTVIDKIICATKLRRDLARRSRLSLRLPLRRSQDEHLRQETHCQRGTQGEQARDDQCN